jgi:hypothetical protein
MLEVDVSDGLDVVLNLTISFGGLFNTRKHMD